MKVDISIGLLIAVLCVLVMLAGPRAAFAQQQVTDTDDVTNVYSDIAVLKAEVVHIREVILSNDRLYIEKFQGLIDATETALAGVKTASEKADAADAKKFESVNEFRAVLTDQQITFATKSEIGDISEYVTRSELWAYLLGGVGMVTALFTAMLALFKMIDSKKAA